MKKMITCLMAFMLCGITAMADETQHRGWKPPKVSMPYDNLTYALKAGIEDPLVTEMRNTDVKQTADLPIKNFLQEYHPTKIFF